MKYPKLPDTRKTQKREKRNRLSFYFSSSDWVFDHFPNRLISFVGLLSILRLMI
ncbi:hypothetical protein AXX17_AT3G16550 [Arabidopsis thaliana]|uniref:Uncharacterized protein n=1 Tax=Arabidopsis thaliana TaxID=3702 RepID=A0A178VBB3_ARATH|nr:hypothetical protein AXX17_AT3G16550 [Arabidopsis thaliana]